MWVFPGLVYQGGDLVQSREEPEPLETFLARLPAPPRATPPAGPPEKKQKLEDTSAEKEWERRRWKSGSSRSSLALPVCEESSSDMDDDITLDPEIAEELARFRASWAEAQEGRSNDFQVTVLGGSWTARHKGVVADAFSGSARGDTANAWCRCRGLPRSARYEIALYGEEHAAALARVWCAKMQYLFNVCLEREDDRHALSPAEVAAWPEPSDLGRIERELRGIRQVPLRIAQIRNLR